MITDPFLDLVNPWREYYNIQVVCQYCCLQIPEKDNGIWDIRFPDLVWNDQTWVIMHCQDFLNVDDTGCRELKLIEKHFGSRADRVVVVVWNIDLESVYSGPLKLVYVPYHSYEILVNLCNKRDQWQLKLSTTRPHAFMSLNGVSKRHRVQTVELLKQFNQGIVSWKGNPIPEFTYIDHLTVTNDENFIKLLPVYGNCDVNVVTESLYDYYPGIITEKTLFSWVALQVPIIIGYPGIVSHARGLGFDMFDDIIDHSYDQLSNDQRISAAVNLNRNILESGIDRTALLPRLLQNQHHALSWPARMIKDYQTRIKKIIGEQ